MKTMVDGVSFVDCATKNERTSHVRRGIRIFSIFAVMIMVLTAFQLLAMPGKAQISGTNDTEAFDSTPSPPQQILNEGPSVEAGPGTVESFNSPTNPYITVSSTGESPRMFSTLTSMNDSLSFRTNYGTYAIDKNNAGRISLISPEGDVLVSESYFTVVSSLGRASPSDLKVETATDDSLSMTYDLIDNVFSKSSIGKMRIEIDFSNGRVPKITAKLIDGAKSLNDWQIVWLISIPSDPTLSSEISLRNGSSTATYWSLLDSKVTDKSFKVEISDINSNESSFGFVADWSDAASGTLGACSNMMSNGNLGRFLTVEFEKGKAVIDPSLIATTTYFGSTLVSTQRKCFFYGGYYWAFYNRGDAICYTNSSDGVTWGTVNVLPNTAIPFALSNVDVAMRNGVVLIGWYTKYLSTYYYHVKSGSILYNKIQWKSYYDFNYAGSIPGSSSVAITDDGGLWCAWFYNQSLYNARIYVWRSDNGGSYWVLTLDSQTFLNVNYAKYLWAILMPTSNGGVALLEASYLSGSVYNTYARFRYYSISYSGWGPTIFKDLGMRWIDKYGSLSAVASPDWKIHVASRNAANASIFYDILDPGNSTYHVAVTNSSSNGYPTISLDSNGILHICDVYLRNSGGKNYYMVRHQSKPLREGYTAWSSEDILYSAWPGIGIEGLTSCANPAEREVLMWQNDTSPYSILYATVPLPYGTPGAPSDPWSREGVGNDIINPGSGMVAFSETDVAIPGRGGIDLSVGRIYQQPKYFLQRNSAPFGDGKFQYCNLGKYWSLNLPWMDGTYICMPGGERTLIQWGNNGETYEFENHEGGSSFTMRSTSDGGIRYIELMTSSGLRYNFTNLPPYKLTTITDLRGYDPNNGSFDLAYNCINISYDANGRISSMTDRGLGRPILFNYNASNVLTSITRPDGQSISFTYVKYNGELYLKTSTDPLGRTTTYYYNASACYLIKAVKSPTQAWSEFSYGRDNTPSTETYSWYGTRNLLYDNATSSIIRQSAINYMVVNGKIVFASIFDKDGSAATQGIKECTFFSSLSYSSVVSKNSNGVQMTQDRTFYDEDGQAVRVDHYKGPSDVIDNTEYMNYDDWGNVIFKKDSLGYETYYSYLNTSTQNSFQGGSILKRSGSSTGKIFYDSFDDWNCSDWTQTMGSGSSVAFNGLVFPQNAPSLKLNRTSTGTCRVQHSFASSGADRYQFIFATPGNGRCNFTIADSSGVIANIYAEDGGFYYKNYFSPYNYVKVTSCSLNVVYDVGIYVRGSNNTYDVYINGICVKAYIATRVWRATSTWYANFAMEETGIMYVDNIRIYSSSLNIIINGLPSSGYIAELLGGNGTVLDRAISTSGGNPTITLSMPPFSLNSLPARIRLVEVAYSGTSSKPIVGRCTFGTPIGDIWSGETYTFSSGLLRSNLPKTTSGYGIPFPYAGASIADEGWPAGSTAVNTGDCIWRIDDGYAVNGTKYHESSFVAPSSMNNYNASHCHGFKSLPSSFTMYSGRIMSQYVWLTPGKVPIEIMLQFFITSNNTWRRVYWGGNSLGNDVINVGYKPNWLTRIGDVPQITGRWLELTFSPSELGIYVDCGSTGVLYGLYGGTAKWDCTSFSDVNYQLYVKELYPGYSVKFKIDDGPTLVQYAGAGTEVYFDLCASGIRTFPISGTFTIYDHDNGDCLIYESPKMEEIWHRDVFAYQYIPPPSDFYPNQIKGFIHDKIVGTYCYQDANGVNVPQKGFIKYDYEGNAIETKQYENESGTGSWVYSRAAYDIYGNQLWTADQEGRTTASEFDYSNKYTYPVSSKCAGRTEFFDFDQSWSTYHSPSSYWLDIGYSTTKYYSSSKSMHMWFNTGGSDTSASLVASKEYVTNPVQSISVKMYAQSYCHDGVALSNGSQERMDSGIKLRLYDSSGNNYDTKTYWLASWYGAYDNGSYDPRLSDSNIKLVCGKPTLNTWITRTLYPIDDFPGTNWTRCQKVKFELYTAALVTNDYFFVFYDDFNYDDFAKNSKTTASINKDTGLQLSSTDPLGHTTSAQSDYIGRTIRTNNTDGTYKTITYDDEARKATYLDEKGHKVVKYFDAIGRQTKIERYNASTLYSTENCSYNWQDKMVAYQNALGYITQTIYDYLGRPTKVTNPNGSIKTISYWDRSTSSYNFNSFTNMTDENGHKMVSIIDDNGRLNRTQEYYGPSSYYTTYMTYDAAGNLLTVKASNSNVTRMYYDPLDRLIKTIYPDSKYELATYDMSGNPVTKTAMDGQVTTSSLDSIGNVFRIESLNDTISTRFNAAGKAIRVANSQATNYYAYNSRDLVSSMSEVIVGNHTVSYQYDGDGKLSNITYPNSIKITYRYDAYDRVIAVDKNTSTRLMNQSYNKDDSVCNKKTNGGQSTNFTYDIRGWVTKIETKNGSRIVLSMNYTYDSVGNVKSMNYRPGVTESFSYDYLNRLVQAIGDSTWDTTIDYTYDSMGNRLTLSDHGSVSYTYGAYNRLVKDSNWNYSYNKNGELVWKNSSGNNTKYNYAFNSLGQMTNVYRWANGVRSTLASYFYDCNGARAKTVENSVTTEYVYIGHDPACERTNGVYIDYISVNGHNEIKLVGGDAYYYIADALGSTRLVYRGNIQVYKVTTYRPFGIAYGVTGGEKFTFAGEMKDSTGMFYLFARYYDPETGRFVSLDPKMGKLSMPQTIDRYVYCANNPMRFKDSTGQWFWDDIAKAISDNWQTVVQVAIVAVSIALTVASAGIASPLMAMAVSAAIGGFTNFASTMIETGGDIGASVQSALFGAALGAVCAGGTIAAIKGLSKISALGSTLEKSASNEITALAKTTKYSRYCSADEGLKAFSSGTVKSRNPIGTFLSTAKTNDAMEAYTMHNLPSVPEVRLDFNIRNLPEFINPPAEAISQWGQQLVSPRSVIEIEDAFITFLT
jgi:RHS repeat-associated protein